MLCKLYCLFIQFMRFSRQAYWGSLPFPPPVDHVLSELSAMTCLSWWPDMAWLIASESYTSPFTRIKQWPMKGGWWGTGRPGMLKSIESQRVGHDLVTEEWQQKFYYQGSQRVVPDQRYQHPLGKFLDLTPDLLRVGYPETSVLTSTPVIHRSADIGEALL